jgi:hypothetical protein
MVYGDKNGRPVASQLQHDSSFGRFSGPCLTFPMPAWVLEAELLPSSVGLVGMRETTQELAPETRTWLSAIGRKGGRTGGRSRSKAKVAASRKNGKLGGRPRKNEETRHDPSNQAS